MEECKLNDTSFFDVQINQKMDDIIKMEEDIPSQIDEKVAIPIHCITYSNNKNYLEMMKLVLIKINDASISSQLKTNELLYSLHFSIKLLPLLFTEEELQQMIFLLVKLYGYDNDVVSLFPQKSLLQILLSSIDNKILVKDLLDYHSLSKEDTLTLLNGKARTCSLFIDKLPYVHCSNDYFNSLNETRFKESFNQLYLAYCRFGEKYLQTKENDNTTPFQSSLFDSMIYKLTIEKRTELYQNLPETPIDDVEMKTKRLFKKISFGSEPSKDQQVEMEKLLHCAPKEVLTYFLQTIRAYPNFTKTIVSVVSKLGTWEVDLMNFLITDEFSKTNQNIFEFTLKLKQFIMNDGEIADMYREKCRETIMIDKTAEDVFLSYLSSMSHSEERTFQWISKMIRENGFGEWTVVLIEKLNEVCDKNRWINCFAKEKVLIELIGSMEIERMNGEKDRWYDRCGKVERIMITGIDLLDEQNKENIYSEIQQYCRKMKEETMWEIVRRLEKCRTKKGIKPFLEKDNGIGENENNERIIVWEEFYLLDTDILGINKYELEKMRDLQAKCDEKKMEEDENEFKKAFLDLKLKIEREEKMLECFEKIRRETIKKKGENEKESILMMLRRTDWFFKQCLCKRICISGKDARICAKIIEHLVERNVAYTNGFLLIDKCIDNMFGISCSISNKEGKCWGIFVGEIMKYVSEKIEEYNEKENEKKMNWHYKMERILQKDDLIYLENEWNLKINRNILNLLNQTDNHYVTIGLNLLIGSCHGIKTCIEIRNKLDELVKHPNGLIRKEVNKVFDYFN